MPGLLDLQRAFAAGLRDPEHDASPWAADDGISASARLRVYRNNARALFEQALELTYPVVSRRVGHDYFRQLAHHYRSAHPSPAGDLHEVGRAFPEFLAAHLGATEYVWLAELARLEWACAEAGVAADAPTLGAAVLAGVAPEAIDSLRFELVPSLRLVASTVPVLRVWRANQDAAAAEAVDLAAGPEYVVVHRGPSGIELRAVPSQDHAFIRALAADATLGAAVSASELALERLPLVLHWLFADGVVADVHVPRSGNPA